MSAAVGQAGIGRSEGSRHLHLVIAGWAGLLHAALAIVASAGLTGELDQPDWAASERAIVDFYRGAAFDGRFVAGVLMVVAAFLLLFVFLAVVADLATRDDGQPRWLAWLIVGGAALEMGFGIFGYLGTFAAAVFRADSGGITEASAILLHDLRFAFYWLDLLAMPVWMVPLGVVIVRTSLLPSWVGWAFLGNAAALLVVFFLPSPSWDPATGLTILLVVVLSVWMMRSAGRSST